MIDNNPNNTSLKEKKENEFLESTTIRRNAALVVKAVNTGHQAGNHENNELKSGQGGQNLINFQNYCNQSAVVSRDSLNAQTQLDSHNSSKYSATGVRGRDRSQYYRKKYELISGGFGKEPAPNSIDNRSSSIPFRSSERHKLQKQVGNLGIPKKLMRTLDGFRGHIGSLKCFKSTDETDYLNFNNFLDEFGPKFSIQKIENGAAQAPIETDVEPQIQLRDKIKISDIDFCADNEKFMVKNCKIEKDKKDQKNGIIKLKSKFTETREAFSPQFKCRAGGSCRAVAQSTNFEKALAGHFGGNVNLNAPSVAPQDFVSRAGSNDSKFYDAESRTRYTISANANFANSIFATNTGTSAGCGGAYSRSTSFNLRPKTSEKRPKKKLKLVKNNYLSQHRGKNFGLRRSGGTQEGRGAAHNQDLFTTDDRYKKFKKIEKKKKYHKFAYSRKKLELKRYNSIENQAENEKKGVDGGSGSKVKKFDFSSGKKRVSTQDTSQTAVGSEKKIFDAEIDEEGLVIDLFANENRGFDFGLRLKNSISRDEGDGKGMRRCFKKRFSEFVGKYVSQKFSNFEK